VCNGLLNVNAVEAVGYHLASHAVQFRGKLGAGCSGMQLSRSSWIGLRVGTNKAAGYGQCRTDS